MNDRGLIFVTGGTGHSGSRAVARLLEEGWRLRCLVRTQTHRSFLPDHPNLEIISGDLTQSGPGRERWIEAMRGADAVLHWANIRFADAVVTACEQAGIKRIICLSSTRRYTKFPDPIAENVIAGEARIEAANLDYTILRPSMIYGGARDNNMEKIVQWLRKWRLMPLIRGGKNLVQPIFVDDLVEAVVRTLQSPETTSRKALTLAGPEPITWKSAIETIGTAMKRKPIWIPFPYAVLYQMAGVIQVLPTIHRVRRDQIQRLLEDKAFDITEANQALDWQPRSFDEGIRLKLRGLDPIARAS